MPAHIEDHPLNQGVASPSNQRGSARDLLISIAVMVIGVILLIAGYIGASGTTDTADQITYIASSTLPGVAVLIAGAVLAARAASVAQQRETAALRQEVSAVVQWLSSATEATDSTEEPPG